MEMSAFDLAAAIAQHDEVLERMAPALDYLRSCGSERLQTRAQVCHDILTPVAMLIVVTPDDADEYEDLNSITGFNVGMSLEVDCKTLPFAQEGVSVDFDEEGDFLFTNDAGVSIRGWVGPNRSDTPGMREPGEGGEATQSETGAQGDQSMDSDADSDTSTVYEEKCETFDVTLMVRFPDGMSHGLRVLLDQLSATAHKEWVAHFAALSTTAAA